MLSLVSLPVDILIIVLEPLGFDDLTALSRTCHLLYSVVTEYGWTNYLRDNPRPSWSLTGAREQQHWSPRARVYYDVMADRGWETSKFIARPLSRMWAGKLQPVLAITKSRLVVGAGSNLYSYAFGSSPNPGISPPVKHEGTISLLRTPDRPRNITALSFVSDGGLDVTLDVAFQDGAIERVQLIHDGSSTNERRDHDAPNSARGLTATRTTLPGMPNGDFVESISSQSDIVLALSSMGHARLGSVSAFAAESTSTPTSTASSGPADSPSSGGFSYVDLKSRSWTSTLCLRASSPYAAFGTASTTPLTIYSIQTDGQLSSVPSAILHTKQAGLSSSPDKLPSNAVYGLAQGPVDSPWGASPNVLVSGWFDGQVRCYDLRVASSSSSSFSASSSSFSSSTSTSLALPTRTPIHTPVLSLYDRWSHEPIYAVSAGGGAGAHIAAGTARHSVVSFFDVRAPAGGWSVYAPGSDPSPVYDVVLESSRFWGVTQSRPFVYDFGPGVSLDTYPPIPQGKGVDNLRQKKGANRATYHVLRREHNSAGLCNEH